MDLTSLPQKSTKWLLILVLSAFVSMAISTDYSQAEDSTVTADDQNSESQSTLVFVETRSNSAETDASDSSHNLNSHSQNALRPATANQQDATTHSNSLRSGMVVRPNQQNTLKLRPHRSTQPQPKLVAEANSSSQSKDIRNAPAIRQPTRIMQAVSRAEPGWQPAPRLSSHSNAEVKVAEHQETVAPSAEVDPIVELLQNAHELSQQASTEQDYSKVLSQCTEAIRLGANAEYRNFARQLSSWSLNRRGQLRADSNQADLADADFRTALDYNQNNWRALHNRGVSFAQNGQFAEAFDDFNQVVKLNPNFAKAYTNRATLYIQTNDLQSALEDYQRALEQDSQLIAALVGMSRTYHLLGRRDEAFNHFSEAIKLDPTNANIVCSRGDLLADMGRYRDALADYARTIELNPEFAHAYRNGAWLLATCPHSEFRDAENAILGAQQALKFDYGDHHVALDTLAAAFANAGQFEEAVETLQEALDIAPKNSMTAYLARLQMYQGQQPFRTQSVGGVSQAVYEVSDR